MIIYKFTQTDAEIDKSIDFDFIKSKFDKGSIFGKEELLHYGRYLLSGYTYDFRGELKKYVVKQNGNWCEYFAPNKTLLRKALSGRIEKIVEI